MFDTALFVNLIWHVTGVSWNVNGNSPPHSSCPGGADTPTVCSRRRPHSLRRKTAQGVRRGARVGTDSARARATAKRRARGKSGEGRGRTQGARGAAPPRRARATSSTACGAGPLREVTGGARASLRSTVARAHGGRVAGWQRAARRRKGARVQGGRGEQRRGARRDRGARGDRAGPGRAHRARAA